MLLHLKLLKKQTCNKEADMYRTEIYAAETISKVVIYKNKKWQNLVRKNFQTKVAMLNCSAAMSKFWDMTCISIQVRVGPLSNHIDAHIVDVFVL